MPKDLAVMDHLASLTAEFLFVSLTADSVLASAWQLEASEVDPGFRKVGFQKICTCESHTYIFAE